MPFTIVPVPWTRLAVAVDVVVCNVVAAIVEVVRNVVAAIVEVIVPLSACALAMNIASVMFAVGLIVKTIPDPQ